MFACSCFVPCFRNAIVFIQVMLLVVPGYSDIEKTCKARAKRINGNCGRENGSKHDAIESRGRTDLFCLRARAP